MINLIENAITIEEQNSILDFVFSNQFPWYFQKRMVDGASSERYTDNKFFSHVLIARQGENEFGTYMHGETPMAGKENSVDWERFKFIFTRNVPDYKVIYRAALNLTFSNVEKMSIPHRDHVFKHRNFICYLNSFSDGYTYLLNEAREITNKIVPQERCAVTFDGSLLHAHGYCKNNEQRLIMVVTYE